MTRQTSSQQMIPVEILLMCQKFGYQQLISIEPKQTWEILRVKLVSCISLVGDFFTASTMKLITMVGRRFVIFVQPPNTHSASG